MQNNDSHDEKVEIVDLDTPNSSWQHHLSRITHRLFARTPTRGKVMVLVLLCGMLVLLIVLQSSLHFVSLGTAHQTPVPQAPSTPPTSQETFVLVSAANGMVYIVERDGSLTARKALDGTTLWQTKSPGEVHYFPVASGQMVYTIVTLDKHSGVEARQASNGRTLWTSSAIPSTPLKLVVQDGVVYANAQGGTIYAFDAATGKALWHFASKQPVPMDAFFSAAKDIAIIRTVDNIVYVLQAHSGKEILHYLPDAQRSNWWFQVDNGIFYNVPDGGPLQAFSISTGRLLWQHPLVLSNFWSLKANNGVIYLDTRDGITALRGQDGKLLWRNAAVAGLVAGLSFTPSIDNNTLYLFLPDSSTLIGIRAGDGKQLWQHKIDGLNRYDRWIDFRNGALYLIQSDSSIANEGHNIIQGRDISTNKLLWHYTPSAPIFWLPNEVDGILYLRYTNGTMDVIRLNDGKLLWRYSARS